MPGFFTHTLRYWAQVLMLARQVPDWVSSQGCAFVLCGKILKPNRWILMAALLNVCSNRKDRVPWRSRQSRAQDVLQSSPFLVVQARTAIVWRACKHMRDGMKWGSEPYRSIETMGHDNSHTGRGHVAQSFHSVVIETVSIHVCGGRGLQTSQLVVEKYRCSST